MTATSEGDATETLARRAGKGLLWLGFVNILSKGSQMVVTLLLAAVLTESDLGLLTVAVAMVNIAQVVQTMGVYEVIARTERDEQVMAGTLLTMSLVVSAALASAGVVGARWIADLVGAPAAAPLVAVVAISLPFTSIGGVQMALMHRDLEFRRRLLPDAGSALLGATVTIALALAGAGPMSLAVGLVVAAVMQPSFSILVGVRVRPQWDRHAAREAAHWIRLVGPAAIIASVLYNVDYPMISRILGSDATGLYSLAFRIAWLPYLLGAMVLGAVAFPVYSKLLRDRRASDIPFVVAQFTRAVLVAVGGVYLVIAIEAQRVELLGERWAPAAPALIVLCGYGLGLSLATTWYELITAAGRLKQFLLFQVAHLVLLVAALLVVTKYGITAAALAQLVVVWCVLPFVWLAMVRSKMAPALRDLVGALLGFLAPALACLGVVLAMRWTGIKSAPTSLVGFGVELSILVSCYAVVAVVANKSVFAYLRNTRRAAQK